MERLPGVPWFFVSLPKYMLYASVLLNDFFFFQALLNESYARIIIFSLMLICFLTIEVINASIFICICWSYSVHICMYFCIFSCMRFCTILWIFVMFVFNLSLTCNPVFWHGSINLVNKQIHAQKSYIGKKGCRGPTLYFAVGWEFEEGVGKEEGEQGLSCAARATVRWNEWAATVWNAYGRVLAAVRNRSFAPYSQFRLERQRVNDGSRRRKTPSADTSHPERKEERNIVSDCKDEE